MTANSRKIALVTGVATVLVGGAGVAAASSAGDDTEPSLKGADLSRASEAALAHTGGGRVTGTEVRDEESYYEVEVTLDDGSQVDVQLDESFAVVEGLSEVEGNDGGTDDKD